MTRAQVVDLLPLVVGFFWVLASTVVVVRFEKRHEQLIQCVEHCGIGLKDSEKCHYLRP